MNFLIILLIFCSASEVPTSLGILGIRSISTPTSLKLVGLSCISNFASICLRCSFGNISNSVFKSLKKLFLLYFKGIPFLPNVSGLNPIIALSKWFVVLNIFKISLFYL